MTELKGGFWKASAWKENWPAGLKRIVGALAFVWAVTFIVCTVTTLYDDHQRVVGRLREVVNEKDNLKRGLEGRDEYIKRLEARSCPLCPASGTNRRIVQAAPTVAATIQSVTAQIRLTCVLKDPTKLPENTLLSVGSGVSYLEGLRGKAYLQSTGKYTYQRTEEEGRATAVEDYTAAPNSELIGQPVSTMAGYSTMVLSDAAVSEGRFTECVYAETTLRVNGVDVFRASLSVAKTLDDNRGFLATIRLVGMKLPQ
jgi:hypothetical protein